MAAIHCDAAWYESGYAIIGIVHKTRVWRIRARANNVNTAELLAISMARKLCGQGTIISDAQVVVNRINKELSLSCFTKQRETSDENLHALKKGGPIQWQKRRTSDGAKLADGLTRKEFTPHYRTQLRQRGFLITNLT